MSPQMLRKLFSPKRFKFNWRLLSSEHHEIKTPLVTTINKADRKKYADLIPEIINYLTDKNKFDNVEPISNFYKRILEYNLLKDIEYYGTIVGTTYKELKANPSEEDLKLADIMGLCVEMVQTSALMADDLVDSSQYRGGTLSWYRQENVGVNVISHSHLVESGLYLILKKYFSDKLYYKQVVELFRDITFKMSSGVAHEETCFKNGKPQFELYTIDYFNSYAKYKTAYVIYNLPVVLAIILSGRYTPELNSTAEIITIKLGTLLQAWNDVLDSLGELEVTGKDTTDIATGRCSWLIVTALERANPAQKKIIEENYGRPNDKAVDTIRSLYEELDLRKSYFEYEKSCIAEVHKEIDKVQCEKVRNAFYKLWKTR